MNADGVPVWTQSSGGSEVYGGSDIEESVEVRVRGGSEVGLPHKVIDLKRLSRA